MVQFFRAGSSGGVEDIQVYEHIKRGKAFVIVILSCPFFYYEIMMIIGRAFRGIFAVAAIRASLAVLYIVSSSLVGDAVLRTAI